MSDLETYLAYSYIPRATRRYMYKVGQKIICNLPYQCICSVKWNGFHQNVQFNKILRTILMKTLSFYLKCSHQYGVLKKCAVFSTRPVLIVILPCYNYDSTTVKLPFTQRSSFSTSASTCVPRSPTSGLQLRVMRRRPCIRSRSGRRYLKLSFHASLCRSIAWCWH